MTVYSVENGLIKHLYNGSPCEVCKQLIRHDNHVAVDLENNGRIVQCLPGHVRFDHASAKPVP